MSRRLKRALIVLAALLVVGAAFVWALPELVKWQAVKQIAALTGRQVSIEDIDVNLFTGRVAIKRFRLAEQDPAGAGGRLEPRGRVDHVAEHRVLAVAADVAHAGDHLAAVDADPQPQLQLVAVAVELAQRSDGLVHRQGGVDRANRIVLMG